MKITKTRISDVLLIEPAVHRDERGFFLETWHAERYAQAGLPAAFVQDNHSCSRQGILRGLHLQLERPQGKLVRALRGEIFDVAVDVRVGSPTFACWVGATLRGDAFQQIWIPAGFAHGFCVLSREAEIEYKCTQPYDPASELTIAWNDPAVGIAWPLDDPELSAKDQAGVSLQSALKGLPHHSS